MSSRQAQPSLYWPAGWTAGRNNHRLSVLIAVVALAVGALMAVLLAAARADPAYAWGVFSAAVLAGVALLASLRQQRGVAAELVDFENPRLGTVEPALRLPMRNYARAAGAVLTAVALVLYVPAFRLLNLETTSAAAERISVAVLFCLVTTAIFGLGMFWLLRRPEPSYRALLLTPSGITVGHLFFSRTLLWHEVAGIDAVTTSLGRSGDQNWLVIICQPEYRPEQVGVADKILRDRFGAYVLFVSTALLRTDESAAYQAADFYLRNIRFRNELGSHLSLARLRQWLPAEGGIGPDIRP